MATRKPGDLPSAVSRASTLVGAYWRDVKFGPLRVLRRARRHLKGPKVAVTGIVFAVRGVACCLSMIAAVALTACLRVAFS
jgi:hypothetical protein